MTYKAKPGYLGVATVDGSQIRCTGFSVNLDQNVLWYDHTIGLRDNITPNIHDTKGDTGESQIQKHIWRASPKLIKGTITFPLTDLNAKPFFDLAKSGDDFDMEFKYTCGLSREFATCKVNSWTLNLASGDIANVTVEIWALDLLEGEDETLYLEEEKLITWDVCNVIVDGATVDEKLANFDVTINNNLLPIYTSGFNVALSLRPAKFRVKMQEVKGTAGVYGDAFGLFGPLEVDAGHTIEVNIGSGLQTFSLNVLYKPLTRSGAIGPLVHTLPFEGVWGDTIKAID